MDVSDVPSVLQDRLGPEATVGLLGLVETARAECEDMTAVAVARLERRLVEEAAGVRVEIARSEGRLREEIARVRVELAQQALAIQQDAALNRFELLKWSFVFWIGQIVVIAGLVGAMT